MGKKSKSKQQRLKGKQINLLHYPNEFYFEVFPQAGQFDLEAYQLQDEEKQIKEVERENDVYFSTVRRVAIDEEYFNWLKKNVHSNTVENRLLYAQTLTDEDVLRLWKKNQLHRTITIRTIPMLLSTEVAVEPKPVNLTVEQTRDAAVLIAQAFHVPKRNVFIHKQLVGPLHCTYAFLEERLIARAEQYFSEDAEQIEEFLPNIPMDSQKHTVLFLPFVVLDEQKAILSRKEHQREAWGLPQLPLVSLELLGKEILGSSEKGSGVKVVPYLLAQKEINEFYQGYVKQNHQVESV